MRAWAFWTQQEGFDSGLGHYFHLFGVGVVAAFWKHQTKCISGNLSFPFLVPGNLKLSHLSRLHVHGGLFFFFLGRQKTRTTSKNKTIFSLWIMTFFSFTNLEILLGYWETSRYRLSNDVGELQVRRGEWQFEVDLLWLGLWFQNTHRV